MNWRALSRQLKFSECSRGIVTRNLQRRETGFAQVLVKRARAAVADHVEWAGDGKGGDGQAARQRLEQDDSERVGARGKDENVRARVDPGQRFAELRAQEARLGPTALQHGPCGTIAHDDGRAGQVQAQHRLEVFLDRDAADGKKNRAGQIQCVARLRAKERVIDAARPYFHPVEAATAEFLPDRGRGRHHRGRRRVKAPQGLVGPALGNGRPRGNIFGKARVVARGEQASALEAIAPRRPADRPLGRDVDVVDRGRSRFGGRPRRGRAARFGCWDRSARAGWRNRAASGIGIRRPIPPRRPTFAPAYGRPR